MDWNDLKIFLAISRNGSLGAAARQLEVSHPTVGRRLQVLEQQCGQPLFRRTSAGLVLTDMGDRILQLAEEIEANALAIERRMSGGATQCEGLLRISSADWFASYVLPPVITTLAQRHPLIVPEIITGPRQFDLTRREADVAFRIVPFKDADIVQRRLMSMPYAVYTSAAQPWAPSDAAARLIVMNTEQSHYPDVQWLHQRLPRASTVFTSSSRTVQAQMCAAGLGIAVLPRLLGDQLPALQQLDLGEPPPGREIWMAITRICAG